jgi:ABC-2 type transport system ATP-binding protein
VLLDEPTLGLDVLVRRRLLDFLRELNQREGVTIVVTSHDMDELEQLASRIVLLNEGQVAFDGAFHQLRRQTSEKRILTLETESATAPVLEHAQLQRSDGNRHEYVFDLSQARLTDIIEAASRQTTVLDVETHRVGIDRVVAELYENWSGRPQPAAPTLPASAGGLPRASS